MDNLNELGLKFGINTVWEKKSGCAWCPALRVGKRINKLNTTDEEYKLRGNICSQCLTMINDQHLKSINDERRRKLNEKKKLLDTLGKSLEQNMSDEDRKKIEELMKTIHAEIKYTEISLESGM